MALLSMENVTFTADSMDVLTDVSISINKGSVTAFLGATGSGKSTALKILAGIISPTKGHVYYENSDIHNMNRKENLAFRKHTGFMFQDSALWANQDIFWNLMYPLNIHYPNMTFKECDAKIHKVAEYVGFKRSFYLRPAALSIGEQKRVSFARSLIYDADILFLDEPTESLDDSTIDVINGILKDFVSAGNTLIFVSHDRKFIEQFTCKKYVFNNGKLVDIINPKSDFEIPVSEEVQE